MRKIGLTTALAAGFAMTLLCMPPVRAAGPQDVPQLTAADFMELEELAIGAKGRPNEEARVRGLKSYVNRRYEAAAKAFEIAALYADKPSQHYLSLMYWHGVGVERDPVQAYIWSDLAAERAHKPLLALREKFWAELTPQQQEQVLEQGAAYYEKYGDEVAKPRAESKIRQFARDMTGSRVGYRNQQLSVVSPPASGQFGVKTGSNMHAYTITPVTDADTLYGSEGQLFRLQGYWETQDRLIDGGKVEVGPLRPVRDRGGDGGGLLQS